MAGNGRAATDRLDHAEREASRTAGPPIPGVIIVWSGEAPVMQPLRLPSLGLILGRELLGPKTTDDRISRQHARVRWSGTSFAITDLGSRNGTYVGGTLVSESEVTVTPPCVLRTGRTVSVLVGDVRPYEAGEVKLTPDGVVGTRRAAAHDALRRAAAGSGAVLVVAEPGAGIDAAVTVFHHAAGGGPLAEIEATSLEGSLPRSERWWVGSDGHPPEVAKAHGGTLVVHDVTALDARGQAGLASILATGELTSAGGKSPLAARVVAVCDPEDLDALRAAVTAGSFRDDLWRQLQPHRIELPPLRTCYDELPHWVVSRVLELLPDLTVHSTLIEACLLRPWPGNIDELRHEVAAAAILSRDGGKRAVRGEHLDGDAGMMVAVHGLPTMQTPQASLLETTRLKRSRIKNPLEVEGVTAALEEHAGDLARAAIGLGVHRNRLRRFLAEHPELAPLVSGDDAHRTAVLTEED